jgi:PIN domain nuclease of toxin-antitoxin system
MPITAQHAAHVDSFPPIHKDAFDHLLLAKALTEAITLLTPMGKLARYKGPVKKVRQVVSYKKSYHFTALTAQSH